MLGSCGRAKACATSPIVIAKTKKILFTWLFRSCLGQAAGRPTISALRWLYAREFKRDSTKSNSSILPTQSQNARAPLRNGSMTVECEWMSPDELMR
jgi:hypothetical protein